MKVLLKKVIKLKVSITVCNEKKDKEMKKREKFEKSWENNTWK